MSALKIESDLSVGDTVYRGHKKLEIGEVSIRVFNNSFNCITTEIFYILTNGVKYTRKEIKSVFEYKTELIELVDSLDDINN